MPFHICEHLGRENVGAHDDVGAVFPEISVEPFGHMPVDSVDGRFYRQLAIGIAKLIDNSEERRRYLHHSDVCSADGLCEIFADKGIRVHHLDVPAALNKRLCRCRCGGVVPSARRAGQYQCFHAIFTSNDSFSSVLLMSLKMTVTPLIKNPTETASGASAAKNISTEAAPKAAIVR